ncbi:MAG TPA: hypothetical protein PKX25_12475, partial [Microthrixaceae bacterium]|nr:hypothetical protein [Microthrixaceae bacterium]
MTTSDTEPTRWRKKPVEIDAWRVAELNHAAGHDGRWRSGSCRVSESETRGPTVGERSSFNPGSSHAV